MQLRLIALLAFASEALAAAMENMPAMKDNPPAAPPPPPAPPATTPPPPNQGEILRILLTALPPSLLNIALTNQPEVSSIIASEFNAGVTEPWFKSLPTPVQSYLVGQGKSGAAAVPTTPTPGGAPFTNVTTPSGTMATTPMIMSPTNTSMTMPMTSTFTASETGTTSLENRPETTPAANQTTSTAGAMPLPLPTAAIGAGFAGAIGIMGMMGL
ncbi:hypothetical protein HDK77DRAFT_186577 [Phyllosticta capitalensis]|uniref:Uncharacterized protein n=1 Tax=Phyllosticta capitalensis TaxID=121624 RepID=A0ABR1YVM9_9PEZI